MEPIHRLPHGEVDEPPALTANNRLLLHRAQFEARTRWRGGQLGSGGADLEKKDRRDTAGG